MSPSASLSKLARPATTAATPARVTTVAVPDGAERKPARNARNADGLSPFSVGDFVKFGPWRATVVSVDGSFVKVRFLRCDMRDRWLLSCQLRRFHWTHGCTCSQCYPVRQAVQPAPPRETESTEA